MSDIDAREDKLPKWAQAELRLLRSDLDRANEALRFSHEGSDLGSSRVRLETSLYTGERIPPLGLGNQEVTVVLGDLNDRRGPKLHFKPSVDGKQVEVRSSNGGLLVKPWVSNVVHLLVSKD
jgi:hypothetical protein